MKENVSNYATEVKCEEIAINLPPKQQNRQPMFEYAIVPRPVYDNSNYIGTAKLKMKLPS